MIAGSMWSALWRTAVNRKFDMCFKCDRMMECDQGEKEIGYFCKSIDKPPRITIKFIEGNMCLFGADDMNSMVVCKEHWNEFEVPHDCDFYAEYFLKECNK